MQKKFDNVLTDIDEDATDMSTLKDWVPEDCHYTSTQSSVTMGQSKGKLNL